MSEEYNHASGRVSYRVSGDHLHASITNRVYLCAVDRAYDRIKYQVSNRVVDHVWRNIHIPHLDMAEGLAMVIINE